MVSIRRGRPIFLSQVTCFESDANNNPSPIAVISLNLKSYQQTGIRSSLAFISLHLKSKQQGLGLPSTNAAGFWGNFTFFVSQITKRLILMHIFFF